MAGGGEKKGRCKCKGQVSWDMSQGLMRSRGDTVVKKDQPSSPILSFACELQKVTLPSESQFLCGKPAFP